MRKRRHWHHDAPPWWRDEDEEAQDGSPVPPWIRHRWHAEHRHPSGEFLFARFALAFGFIVLLGCGFLLALAAGIAFLFRQPFALQPGRLLAIAIGVALLLAFAIRRASSVAARRFTSPLSETMKAADALAEGDLAARVPVEGSGEFRRLARSFNAMAVALESADQQRRDLLADVAHELRTPLTVIQGNLEGLRDGVYQSTPEHLDLLLDETHKLSRLVEDLRLLTLAEAGQLSLDLQPLDVRQLLLDVRDAFDPAAAEAGVSVDVEAREPLPLLRADPQRLGQVLGNAVANALQHTPAGGQITLGAATAVTPPSYAGPEGNAEGVRLWVADTGQGIPAEDLPRIFDRFWRGDPARTHRAGAGSGLGLAIAKSLVEAHGGRIWAESQAGHGTTITCLLPASPTTPTGVA